MGKTSSKIKNFLRNKKVVSFFAILLFLVLVYGRRKTVKIVSVQKVEKGNIEVTVTASGTVRSENDIKVQFQTSGKLAWLGVKEGDLIKKGQALASLDKESLKKSLAKSMNLYMTNRWDFEQNQDDYKSTKEKALLTDEIKRILDKYQYSLNNAVIDVEVADMAVKYATIYSPIGGIVVDVQPSVAGGNIVSTLAYVEVVDPKTLEFTAIVDETDIGRLKEGQKTAVVLDAFPDKEFSGLVKRIDFKSTITSSGGTGFTIHVSLPEEEIVNFRDGMNGDLKIILQTKENALLLPADSLVEKNSKNFVYKFEKGKAVEVLVTTGVGNDSQLELVTGDLKEGDLLVTESPGLLEQGQVIQIK